MIPYIPPFPILPPRIMARIKSSIPPTRRLYPDTTTLFIPVVTIRDKLVPVTKVRILRSIRPSPLREKPSSFPPQRKHTRTPIKPSTPPRAFLPFILSSLEIKWAMIVENITPVPLRMEQFMEEALIMAIYWKAYARPVWIVPNIKTDAYPFLSNTGKRFSMKVSNKRSMTPAIINLMEAKRSVEPTPEMEKSS